MAYDFNEEAARIGERVVSEWHPHLEGVKIAYITKEAKEADHNKSARGGKAIKLGSASALSDKYRLLAAEDYAFIIELNGAYWDRLSLEQQEALIDHELCHCRKDADGFYIADHDLEEFRQILRRHGFWKPDIQAFCEEARPLFEKPGVQKRFVSPSVGDVAVCAGQVIRIEETGDTWTFSLKDGFVKLGGETEITLKIPGHAPVTTTQSQMRAALDAMKSSE